MNNAIIVILWGSLSFRTLIFHNSIVSINKLLRNNDYCNSWLWIMLLDNIIHNTRTCYFNQRRASECLIFRFQLIIYYSSLTGSATLQSTLLNKFYTRETHQFITHKNHHVIVQSRKKLLFAPTQGDRHGSNYSNLIYNSTRTVRTFIGIHYGKSPDQQWTNWEKARWICLSIIKGKNSR